MDQACGNYQAAAARTAGLHDYHQCQRLAVGVFFQYEFLFDAVIGKDEIIGSEPKDRFAAAGLYQRRHQTRLEPRRRIGVGSEISCAGAQAPQRTWKVRQTSKRNFIGHICFAADTASGMSASEKRSASASRCRLARLRARLPSAFACTAPCSSHASLLKTIYLPCYPYGTSRLLLDLWECNRWGFIAS